MRVTLIAGLLVSLSAGIWLDRMAVLNQTQLFVTFHVVSLLGMVFGVLWWRDHGKLTLPRQMLLIIAAAIAWRISYFPIMVFAGWVGTLSERLIVAMDSIVILPIIIYPIFLLSMFVLFIVASLAAGAIVAHQYRAWMVITVPAFIMASLVSLSRPTDIRWLPDAHVSMHDLSQPLPAASLPTANPYLPLLDHPEYPLQKRTLLLAAGSIYGLVPHSPWGGTVKGTLEVSFRNNPGGSTATRIKDHYEAYHVAHKHIDSGRSHYASLMK